jgi:hypothetical protein
MRFSTKAYSAGVAASGDNASMTTPEYGPDAVRLGLHIPLDGPYLGPVIEAFADGSIRGLIEHDGELQVDLVLPGPLPAALAAAELRLDRVEDNWRLEWRQTIRLLPA